MVRKLVTSFCYAVESSANIALDTDLDVLAMQVELETVVAEFYSRPAGSNSND